MDTQTSGTGNNKNTGIPSMPPKSSIEPPVNLPFADDEKPAQDLPAPLKTLPKIVPGVRGPLPSAPARPMINSSAKFGIGTSIKGSALKESKKVVDPNQKPISETSSSPAEVNIKGDDGETDSNNNAESKSEESEVGEIPIRSRIGVPQPPVAPDNVVAEKEMQGLHDKESKDDSAITGGKNIPPPTAPAAGSVDRNIRPRRLAIVIIVLLLFIAAIFMSAWYFLTRNIESVTPPDTTESSLFSPEPTNGGIIPSPTPSPDLLTQADSDGDGLTDAEETQLGTDLFNADSDGDGYVDKQEIDAGYDPRISGGKLDTDRDGLSDPDEKCWGTDLNNADSDGDGYLDGQEVVNGYDPLIASPNDKLSGVARCAI